MPDSVIEQFEGSTRWASNFFVRDLTFEGVACRSAEHAFNAWKTEDETQRRWVLDAPTPGEAKRRGRGVHLRSGWDATVRYEIMSAVTAAKFVDAELQAKLLATGDTLLIEGNHHHDDHWGDCYCDRHRNWPGQNHLGRILMAHRARLRQDRPDRWTRAAVTGHRPQHMSRHQARFARTELTRLAVKLRAEHDTTTAISGMALGADTWWAHAALEAGLDLWTYIPFPQQPGRWQTADRDRWAALRTHASREVILGASFDVRLLHGRNDLMIRDTDLLVAVYDPSKTTGGTASAVRKAVTEDVTTIIVDLSSFRTRIVRPDRRRNTQTSLLG